jgi:DNA-binding FadR family transcriptional regulator
MEVTALNKSTLSEQIMEQIASQIVSGELKAGEKLPTERAFATMFGVTRNRVREALRALSLIGMIVIKPGGGSFVAQGDEGIPRDTVTWMYHRQLQNVDDIYAARKLIETEVYITLYENKTDEIIENIEKYFSVIKKANLKKISGDEFLGLLSDMDLYIGSVCGNGVYDKLMQTMILLRKESAEKILNVPGSKKSAVQSRGKIVEALKNGTLDDLKQSLEAFYRDSLKNLH